MAAHLYLIAVFLFASLAFSQSREIKRKDMMIFFKVMVGEIPKPAELESTTNRTHLTYADQGNDQGRGAGRRDRLPGSGRLNPVPESALIFVDPVNAAGSVPRQRNPSSLAPTSSPVVTSTSISVAAPAEETQLNPDPSLGASSGSDNGNLNDGDNNGNNNGNCRGNCHGNENGNVNGNENQSNNNGNNNGNCVGNCFFNMMGNANGNGNTKDNQGNNNGNCFGNCFYRFAGNNIGNEDSEGQVNGVGNCVGNCFTVPRFALRTDFGDLNKYEIEKDTPQCFNEGSFYRPIDGTICRGVERMYMIGSGSSARIGDTRYLCHPGCVFDYAICGCQHWFMVSYKTCSSGIRA